MDIYTIITNYWGVFATALMGITAYIFGGKRAQFLANKRTIEDTKVQAATALEGMQNVYDKYIEHDKARTEKLEQRIEALELHNRELQTAFNNMSISYSVVMEQSKEWEKKYIILEKEYSTLKTDHDKLKIDFDKYKKENKQ